MFSIHVQKMKSGKHRVVITSVDNGKLVLSGEPLNRRIDADKVQVNIHKCSGGGIDIGHDLPAGYRFPANAGPRKAKKKK